VEDVVVTFSVQLPDAEIEDGVQLASMPAGNTLSTSPTVPVNPLIAAIVIVKVVLLPAITLCEFGAAEIEKSARLTAPETVRVKNALFIRVPLVPVTLTG
jgi:hypothetical protein